MIKAKPKPINEIVNYIAPYQDILVVGCGGCVSVCLAGGQKEVSILGIELELAAAKTKSPARFVGYTV